MKTSTTEGTLTLYFENRIDSNNAAAIEAEAMSALEQSGAGHIIIDAGNLEYISSAGLRIVLKLAKKDKTMRVINVPAEVYEIFQMTGFAEMLNIEKALRQISLDGCPVIGQGAVGTLYRYDEETVVKLYREGASLESLKEERERSKMALVMGVPTIISYDIVKVGNCYATVYELITSHSMGSQVSADPSLAEEMGVKFANVLKTVHRIDASEIELPRERDVYARAWNNMAPNYSEEERAKVLEWLDAMPEANVFLHGDFHPKNIMLQNGEPLLIDMGDISIGHPMHDIGTAYFVIFWHRPERSLKVSGIPREVARTFWDAFMKTYFETEDAEILAELEKTIACIAHLRAVVVNGIANNFPQEIIDLRVSDMREKAFPISDEILERIKGAGDLYARYSPVKCD